MTMARTKVFGGEVQPEEPRLKDSGARQEFDTGSKRDLGTGKGAYDLLQEAGVHAVAMQLERGAHKYGFRNWELGQPCSRYVQSARRHISYAMMGLTDEPHWSAAAWNILCLISTKVWIAIGKLPKELDDLPPPLPKEQQEELLKQLKQV